MPIFASNFASNSLSGVTTGDPLSVSFASSASEGSTVYYTIE